MLDAEEYFHLAVHASFSGDHHACLMYLMRRLLDRLANQHNTLEDCHA